MNEEFAKLFERIGLATVKDLEHKGPQGLFVSTATEFGEVAQELAIEEAVFGHTHKQVGEGVFGESVDLAICALSLHIMRGGTVESFIDYANKKMAKWEAKLIKSQDKQ